MSFCKHYPSGGLADNTHCKQGVEMQSTRDTSIVPHRFPCFTAEAEHLCVKYEGPTAEEIAEDRRQAAETLKQMLGLMSGTADVCPHCGAHIDHMEQVGACVYARPCNCRQYQGTVPDAGMGQS